MTINITLTDLTWTRGNNIEKVRLEHIDNEVWGECESEVMHISLPPEHL